MRRAVSWVLAWEMRGAKNEEKKCGLKFVGVLSLVVVFNRREIEEASEPGEVSVVGSH